MSTLSIKWIDDTHVQISCPDNTIFVSLGNGTKIPPAVIPVFPTSTSVGPALNTLYEDLKGPIHLWDGGLTSLVNKRITGSVLIQTKNVVIDNCIITNNDGGATGVIRVDTSMTDGAGLIIKNSIIDGAGITVNGIAAGGTFTNNKIVGVENGINIYGPNPTLIEGNYIQITKTNGAAPHYDAIENNGASNVTIRHNTIINANPQTSAVMLNNYFGGLANIQVINNYMEGGGYTLYVDNTKGGGPVDGKSILIQNNVMKKGLYGYFSLYTSGVTPTNNTDAVTGATI